MNNNTQRLDARLKNKQAPFNKHWHLLSLVLHKINKQWVVEVHHFHREGNQAADWMTNKAFHQATGTHFSQLWLNRTRGYSSR
ncbi:hypothetical protein Scep_026021 [Stephania cephalantha]|uniref:RNase H type-1 domain-containing protein n=1 Tax=Stephania cephalantha TaxID=152367 RepID=A0AAP0EMK1_9MAGN